MKAECERIALLPQAVLGAVIDARTKGTQYDRMHARHMHEHKCGFWWLAERRAPSACGIKDPSASTHVAPHHTLCLISSVLLNPVDAHMNVGACHHHHHDVAQVG